MSGFPKERSFLSGVHNTSNENSIERIQWDVTAKLARAVMKQAVRYYLRFSEDNIKTLPAPDFTKDYLLYIHIPFCATLCPYCSFHRFKIHEETARKYFLLLREEMRMTADLGYNFTSAYFGGGTTSILPDELAKTIELARELFDIKEISCETDPNHIDDASMKHTVGRIDRLSVGVQSFNDMHLESIGRLEKFGSGEKQFEKISNILKEFSVVNIDMIYNFPSQTEAELITDIKTVRKLSPQQVTFYPLMYAPFAGEKLKKLLGKSEHKTEAEFYKIILKRMTSPYIQKTSWNFAINEEQFIDEYVVEHSEYVGLGSGAFSFLNNTLYANSFSLKRYAEKIRNGRSSVSKSVSFSKHSISQYRMMVEMFGLSGRPAHRPLLEYTALKSLGAVSRTGSETVITPKGRFILSTMMKGFYNGMDYIRETMRKDLTREDEYIK
ncbi:Coproporphyrinogen dehydrogenase [Denitrovibrio acetiphilus DSM 12809]|uniref:Coproporphyrinogen dehydrogenase n=1 Tax=Denitrovibrio acetiphilus (strain DSM 12809 / NBRC 114555 / N2460) TaxID=522772 RepID=D4H7A8_DENA2|nr:coproporphyrinogen III oxidase family protein [Denitrovibrio acetiphilus]ADD67907.1 Coproporphyrinogen dehydrogenase [Denitrovibrio acetiphilus DSM 12809]